VQLTKLQETLLVLGALKNQLQPALKVIKRYMADDDLKFTATNHLMILVSSFLDEWKRLEGLGFDPDVRKTLDTAKPAVNRIRQWRGISRLRSSMLAHGFRQKDGSLTQIAELLQPGRAPVRYAEQVLLAECAVYAISTAICQHRKAHREAVAFMYQARSGQVSDGGGVDTMGEFHQEVARIRVAITASDPSLEACFNGSQEY
jgi:hypothetical protein